MPHRRKMSTVHRRALIFHRSPAFTLCLGVLTAVIVLLAFVFWTGYQHSPSASVQHSRPNPAASVTSASAVSAIPPCVKYITPPESVRQETTLSIDLTQANGTPAEIEFLIVPAEQLHFLADGGVKSAQSLRVGDSVRMESNKIGHIRSVQTKLYRPEAKVTSRNSPTAHRVLAKSKRWTETILKLHTSTEVIETTPEHPFYVNGSWVEAKNLKPGNQITSKTGNPIAVVKTEQVNSPQYVYNLLVEDAHNFYVGKQGLLAHNCTDVVKAIQAGLPNRNGVGATSGYLLDSNGNMLLYDLIVSGNTVSLPAASRSMVRDPGGLLPQRGTVDFLHHVETKVARYMQENNISNATLVLNNHPCTGRLSCSQWLESVLPLEGTLRVIVPDGFDARGPFDQVFKGK